MTCIEKLLDLSTAHVPKSETTGSKRWRLDEMKEEGDCWEAAGPVHERPPRVAVHEYGWIVFVSATWNEDGTVEDMESAMDGVPEWLAPIYRHAIEEQCMLIKFDADGPTWELEFETYE